MFTIISTFCLTDTLKIGKKKASLKKLAQYKPFKITGKYSMISHILQMLN